MGNRGNQLNATTKSYKRKKISSFLPFDLPLLRLVHYLYVVYAIFRNYSRFWFYHLCVCMSVYVCVSLKRIIIGCFDSFLSRQTLECPKWPIQETAGSVAGGGGSFRGGAKWVNCPKFCIGGWVTLALLRVCFEITFLVSNRWNLVVIVFVSTLA